MILKILTLSGMALLAHPLLSRAAAVYHQVLNYHGAAQNPFVNNPGIELVYIQDFEAQSKITSNKLTTTNASAWNGGTNGPSWGVSSDETSPDNGWAWSYNVSNPDWRKAPSGLLFEFSPDEFGRYPEYVGAALLGYNDYENVGGLYNSIFVYDRNGNEVTGGEWKLPRPHYTEADLATIFTDFEGIYVPGGISSIQFRDFTDVDHLTYGYAPLPEPGTIPLAGLATTMLLLRRRSRG